MSTYKPTSHCLYFLYTNSNHCCLRYRALWVTCQLLIYLTIYPYMIHNKTMKKHQCINWSTVWLFWILIVFKSQRALTAYFHIMLSDSWTSYSKAYFSELKGISEFKMLFSLCSILYMNQILLLNEPWPYTQHLLFVFSIVPSYLNSIKAPSLAAGEPP